MQPQSWAKDKQTQRKAQTFENHSPYSRRFCTHTNNLRIQKHRYFVLVIYYTYLYKNPKMKSNIYSLVIKKNMSQKYCQGHCITIKAQSESNCVQKKHWVYYMCQVYFIGIICIMVKKINPSLTSCIILRCGRYIPVLYSQSLTTISKAHKETRLRRGQKNNKGTAWCRYRYRLR